MIGAIVKVLDSTCTYKIVHEASLTNCGFSVFVNFAIVPLDILNAIIQFQDKCEGLETCYDLNIFSLMTKWSVRLASETSCAEPEKS